MVDLPRGGTTASSVDDGDEAFDPRTFGDSNTAGNAGGGDGGRGDGDDFDPDLHIARDKRNADGSYRRKRGRNGTGGGTTSRGSGGKKGSHRNLDVSAVAASLSSIHFGVGIALKCPAIWALEDSEAKKLAEAVVELEKHYPTKIDPKMVAWFNFLGVFGAVEITRIIATMAEAKANRAANVSPGKIPPAPPVQPAPANANAGAFNLTPDLLAQAQAFRHANPGDNFQTSFNP